MLSKKKLTWEGGQKLSLLAELNRFGPDGGRGGWEQLQRRAQAHQPRSWTTAAAAAAGGHSSRQLKHRCIDPDIELFGTGTDTYKSSQSVSLLQIFRRKKVTFNGLNGTVS
jgi:hypothetical protein